MTLLSWSSVQLRMAESNFIFLKIRSPRHCLKTGTELHFIVIISAKKLISILKLRLTERNSRLGLLTAGHESFLRINVNSIY
jgi:hypothetical protein